MADIDDIWDDEEDRQQYEAPRQGSVMDANPMTSVKDAIALIIRDACETDPNWATPPDTLIQIVESDLRAILEDHLSALSQPPAVAVPEGMMLVPVEPTPTMADEGREHLPCTPGGVTNATAANVYAAMVSAAPPAPQAEAWRDIASAPRDRTDIIVAVPSDARGAPIIGTAYFDPDAPDGGSWWWCGTSRQDYFDSSIEDGNDGPPTHWQPLPAPPQGAEKARNAAQEGGR